MTKIEELKAAYEAVNPLSAMLWKDEPFIVKAYDLMPQLLKAVEQRDRLVAAIEATVGWNAVDLFPEDFK